MNQSLVANSVPKPIAVRCWVLKAKCRKPWRIIFRLSAYFHENGNVLLFFRLGSVKHHIRFAQSCMGFSNGHIFEFFVFLDFSKF